MRARALLLAASLAAILSAAALPGVAAEGAPIPPPVKVGGDCNATVHLACSTWLWDCVLYVEPPVGGYHCIMRPV